MVIQLHEYSFNGEPMKDSIQEQLAEARRNQILNAAAKVFAQKGFHQTTIRDLAHEAGIADGTIYNYFENKTALLFGIFDLMTKSAQQAAPTMTLPGEDFRAFLKVYLTQPLMALRAGNFELFRVVISEIMVNRELRELYYQKLLGPALTAAEPYFQQWVARGVIRPVDLGLTMRALSGMMLGLILENVMGDEQVAARWDDLPDFLTDLIMEGLRNHS